MNIKKARQDTLRFAGNFILYYLLNILCKSLKISFENNKAVEELEKQNKNYVAAFWHGTMLLPWYINRNKNFIALISKSKDGDLLSKILRNWNYNVVRGSSTTGGNVALGIMIDYAKNNQSIAVTPDGPRGPKEKFKAGAAITAKKSGIPLVLIGVGYKKKRKLKSWDSFEVPKFFSPAKVIFSEPIYIERNFDYEQTNNVIMNCEVYLKELQCKAGKF